MYSVHLMVISGQPLFTTLLATWQTKQWLKQKHNVPDSDKKIPNCLGKDHSKPIFDCCKFCTRSEFQWLDRFAGLTLTGDGRSSPILGFAKYFSLTRDGSSSTTSARAASLPLILLRLLPPVVGGLFLPPPAPPLLHLLSWSFRLGASLSRPRPRPGPRPWPRPRPRPRPLLLDLSSPPLLLFSLLLRVEFEQVACGGSSRKRKTKLS